MCTIFKNWWSWFLFYRTWEPVHPDHVCDFFLLLWFVVIVLDVDNVSCSSDLFSGFSLTVENLGQERLWTRSVWSSTLQQLQLLERRRRRKLAKCRWVWLACQNQDWQRVQEAPDVRTVLAFAGHSGRSNHQCQPPAGGFWQRQDCEEWQLLSLCESLGHRRVFSGLTCPKRHVWVINSTSCYSCANSFVYNIIFFTCKGKFIRIHFGTTGKLASADIETCE